MMPCLKWPAAQLFSSVPPQSENYLWQVETRLLRLSQTTGTGSLLERQDLSSD